MTKKSINQSLKTTVSLDTPDLLEQLKNTPIVKMESEDYIIRQPLKNEKSNKFRFHKYSLALISSFCLIFFVCFGFIENYNNTIDSIISMDINPSIEINTNRSNKVLEVKALNNDAKSIINNLDFKHQTLDDTIQLIITSLVNNGYITDNDKSSILVSVSNSNEQKASEIKNTIITDINNSLENSEISLTVFNQQICDDSENELMKLADNYNISYGKAVFIYNLVTQDETLNIEELANLSMSKISELVEEKNINLDGIVECEEINNTEISTEILSTEISSTETIITETVTENLTTEILEQNNNPEDIIPNTAINSDEIMPNPEDFIPNTEIKPNTDNDFIPNTESIKPNNNTTSDTEFISKPNTEISTEILSTEISSTETITTEVSTENSTETESPTTEIIIEPNTENSDIRPNTEVKEEINNENDNTFNTEISSTENNSSSVEILSTEKGNNSTETIFVESTNSLNTEILSTENFEPTSTTEVFSTEFIEENN